MSVPDRIVDKLRNYEYEKCGYESAIIDIYALIHHIAKLEEEIDRLKAAASRTVEGDGSDLPVGTVVIDRGGHPLMKADDEWNVARFDDYTRSLTADNRAPYTIVWTPEENTSD